MKRAILLTLSAIGTLAIIFVISIFLIGRLFSSPDGNDFNIEKEIISPNGNYRAIHYLGMGGGAAGWCQEIVSIEPKETPILEKNQYRVFSVSCGSKVAIKWVGNSTLQINFFPKEQFKGVSIYLTSTNQDGKIKIDYKYKA